MIAVVVAVVIGAVAFIVLWRELASGNRPRRLSTTGWTAAVALALTLAIMAGSGRLHWLAALFAGALPLLRWALGLVLGPVIGHFIRSRMQGANMPPPGDTGPSTSTVATDELRMTLVHDSGEMDGEAITGTFAGKRLSSLDLDALRTLYGELGKADSLQLLEAYLDRRFPGWSDEEPKRQRPSANREMDAEQALAVLGLSPGASKEEIVDAHRRLMQKLHPDRGGSDYLAATLNLAKQVLLGNNSP
ncbi:MAG: molecular chaperone DnaJ [Gammaproteobacteria bacterium]|nr:molecular chaperone DnaJ [Gammaproteobacteria bacterium]MXY54957.1 molecular chaperone DnaJ [Gammaproteobacteria bacterium]MYF27357.1 molecular chaperone DnaJ [Gammaproteobacteria bacterium]MYK46099.1 molecular chaperone DnaJ [Gammaproteobacteria bacterium]